MAGLRLKQERGGKNQGRIENGEEVYVKGKEIKLICL